VNNLRLGSSFRDPSGFVFARDGVLYRQINNSYAHNYEQLMQSGLYASLVDEGLLIPHDETDAPAADPGPAHKIIRPQPLPYISYPYEWPFSALKAAALATLRIQEVAMGKGMSLKDASAFNIQFQHAAPVLIDTLSFEPYRKGQPWVAYQQFCKHLLAPLALMAKRDVRFGLSLQVHLDGIGTYTDRSLARKSLDNPSCNMRVVLKSTS